MNTILKPLSLRALFLSLSLVLAAGLVAESALTPAADAYAAEGLSDCGTEDAPCVLEPVAVEIVVEGGEYLASTASARQMMRIGS